MSLQGLRREIHGFEPGSVVAATELVMSHVHPEDADSARESQEAVLERSEAVQSDTASPP